MRVTLKLLGPLAVAMLLSALVSCKDTTAQDNVTRTEQKPPPVQTALEPAAHHDPLRHPDEKRLRNIRQLTFGGRNAEAYFSFDEKQIIFQSTRPPYECDQMFIMNIDGSDQRLVSTGKGRTTCGFFLPGDSRFIYSSTHLHGDDCPPAPDKSKGYVWGVFDDYDIFVANADGSGTKVLAQSPGYDAEPWVSPVGDLIVFTSTRDGDLDLYTMKSDGSDVRRITTEMGYDGGAVFSMDGKRIVYRAHHPTDPDEVAEYKELLAQQLVKPNKMDIFVCDADGGNKRQLTNNGAANFSPAFLPDNKRVVFSSNMREPGSRKFGLFLMNDDGSAVEQVTYGGVFNAFPMFTRDGKKIMFISDRNASRRYEYNVFIADWVD